MELLKILLLALLIIVTLGAAVFAAYVLWCLIVAIRDKVKVDEERRSRR